MLFPCIVSHDKNKSPQNEVKTGMMHDYLA